MPKHYTVVEPDGKRTRLSADMFDFIVGATLTKCTRDGSWVSAFAVARRLYDRPNMISFRNVGAALARLHASDPKRFRRWISEDGRVTTYQFKRSAR